MRSAIICLNLFLLLISIESIGQRKVIFGISGGWNNASISGKVNDLPLSFSNQGYAGQVTSLSFNGKPGITGGFLAIIPIGKQSFFQPELLYSMMGTKFTMNMSINQADNVFPVPIHGKFNLGYLALPLLYKYKLEDCPGGWGFYGGLQPAYVLTNSTSIEGSTAGTTDLAGKKFDFQGILGVEFFLANGLGATCRYQMGILTREENIGPVTTQNIRNNALSISLGYHFKSSKKSQTIPKN